MRDVVSSLEKIKCTLMGSWDKFHSSRNAALSYLDELKSLPITDDSEMMRDDDMH